MPKRIMVHLTRRMGGQPKCGKHVPPEKKVTSWPDQTWQTKLCPDCHKYKHKKIFYIFNELLD